MKTNPARLLAFACLFITGVTSALAQDRPRVELHSMDGTFKVLGAQSASGKVVANQPYSAVAITETVQTLSDGNQIIRNNQAKLFRDSLGRTRNEQTLETIGKWSADGQAQQLITLNDPVAGISYRLDPQSNTAFKSTVGVNSSDALNLDEKLRLREKMDKAMAQKKELLAAGQGKMLPSTASPDEIKQMKMKAATAAGAGAEPPRKEPLGKQIIEGVEAEGLRVNMTIPAGSIGNKLPIEIFTETWYSPELQLIVLSKQHDPRYGDTTYRLTNISRNEPDAALFQVPAGYTIKENSLIKKPLTTNDQ